MPGPTTLRRRTSLASVFGILILVTATLSGCASAPPTPPGMFSFYLGEPQRPLVPGNTTESEGSKIISAVWTPLVTFDVKSRAVTYDGAAQSVTSADNVRWTIKLKPGWTFHDGTPVTAESYVKAWNYTALSTNAQGGSYSFPTSPAMTPCRLRTAGSRRPPGCPDCVRPIPPPSRSPCPPRSPSTR